MNVDSVLNNASYQNKLEKNDLNDVNFKAGTYINRWRYANSNDWIDSIVSEIPKKASREILEIYGGPKKASPIENFAENIKGLLYPITKFFTRKKCIKVTENPHKYPYATREEIYSDGSRKEIEYGAQKELIYMWELNKEGKPTRSVRYNWNCGDYTVQLYDENSKVKKIYPSVKYPFYPRLGSL